MTPQPTEPDAPAEGGPLRCPRCDAPLAPDQEWCLECGAAARSRIVPPPNWRIPVIVVAAVVLLAGAGLAFAVTQLSDDEPLVAGTAAPTVTSVPATEPAPNTEPEEAPEGTPAPQGATTPGGETAPTGEVASWPEGEEAWTVVLLSSTDEAGARARAAELAKAAPGVGLLESSNFESLRPGFFVVYAGQFESQEKAQEAAAAAASGAPGAYARFIDPK